MHLGCRRDDADAADAVLEAAWAITNLAAGRHEVVEAVVVSAPALIAHLSGWLGLPVAEQCAWALGMFQRPNWPGKPDVHACYGTDSKCP